MTEMQSLIDLIPSVGIYAVITIGLCLVIYKIVFRMMDENKTREDRQLSLLNEISNTIRETALISKDMEETNRLLVDKVSDELKEIDSKLEIILKKEGEKL